MKIRDLQDSEYKLVQTDYEVGDLLRDYGNSLGLGFFDNIDYGAFIKLDDSGCDIEEVYIFEGPVPYLDKDVIRLK